MQRNRQAFTLIELLVVIAIIGVLVALLVPAVQKTRDAAARIQCANNLRQTGLGVHGYLNTKGYFPGNNIPPGNPYSVRPRWFTGILPYVEQNGLFRQYDFNSSYDGSNLAVSSVQIAIAQCPSSSDPNRLDGNPDSAGSWAKASAVVAVTDYAGFYGVHNTFLQSNSLTQANPEGMIANTDGKAISTSSVTDGLSNTVFAAESAGRPYLYNQGGVRQSSDWQSSGVNGGGWTRTASEIWLIGSFKDGTQVGGPISINACNGFDHQGAWPLTIGTPALGKDGSGQAFSFHAVGANFLFADGSVHFLQATINPAIMAALVTRAGNDLAVGY